MTAFDQFLWAIGQQESGGNYSVVNAGSGALGKYQIMPANVPYWSQKYLGVTWTPDQFLNDPTKQEALVRAVLGSYWDKYGPRGAAATWYSGRPDLANNYGGQPGGPSVGAYVDSVMSMMGGAPGDALAVIPGSGSVTVASRVIDNTVKDSTPADKPMGGNDSGMGAVTAPGAEAASGNFGDTSNGAEAVTGNGAEAAGSVSTGTDLPTTSATNPPDGLGPFMVTPAVDGQGSNVGRNLAINAAQKWLGTPYVWGGGGTNGPSGQGTVGFDCSGLIQYALAQAGITMPRLSYDQLGVGNRTSVGSLQPGDLVGFGDGGHIALYLGNNQIVEAPTTGSNVRVRTLGSNEGAWGVSLANLYQ